MSKFFLQLLLTFWGTMSLAQSVEDALIMYQKEEYQKAYEISKSCFDIDSTNIDCLLLTGRSAFALGDHVTAKEIYHLTAQKDSSLVEPIKKLASIYDQQGQLPRAIKYYTLLNERLPENSIYYRKNARLYQSYGDKAKSFELYTKAHRLNRRDALSIKGIAELLLDNQQIETADSMIDIGLQLDSTNISFNYLSAKAKYKQKDYASVIKVFDRIRGKVDLSSYYNKMLGYSYLQIDSVDLAINKLQLALVDDKESEKLHYYLATAFEKKDNIEGAQEHYKKAVKYGISPDLDLYHRNVARIAKKQNDLPVVIASYRDAYKYGKDPVVLYYLATACDEYYKDKNIAINYYKKYINSNHSNEAYISYAKKRSLYLKENMHQGSK